ncbi:hypothetical protein WOLCODRAFT_83588 [Wolfiporia cocos MD-104 SS10]|uniref:Uncharacterized protein n=1 Tax=Wolfiporia cocos (strain MD-104) TaxID=742152 RepID=A0A2H3J4F6_WOLCO|nr:hypothetical protein WOLCODRAFT_83588 [Wolfiporia cocos MD-104 SS10]
MEQIIHEHGLWLQTGLNAQCEGFKCPPGWTGCCCHHLLFTQPDFSSQKSQLEEYISLHGHLCDFYPKYHCELNFIEQYWGCVKLDYRTSPMTFDTNEMECNVLHLSTAETVTQGLSSAEAVWANRKYHGHHTLPSDVVTQLKTECKV